jgi:proline dehydrogenase
MGPIRSKALFLIERAAGAYVAGSAIDHAQAICHQASTEGLNSTMCYWNVASDPAEYVADLYGKILDEIPNLAGDCYLSVKAPAINFDLELLKAIIERAKSIGAFVHFDAMAPETADDTFRLIAKARNIYPKLGCTLPGRWRRSLSDTDRAGEMGLRVRVVKGQWALSSTEMDPEHGFLKIIDRLAAKRTNHVAVATHQADLARKALTRLQTTGTSCELELLYGLPLQPLMKIGRALNVPVRLYVPFGRAGLPYRLKQIPRNPRFFVWFLRDLWRARIRCKLDAHPALRATPSQGERE